MITIILILILIIILLNVNSTKCFDIQDIDYVYNYKPSVEFNRMFQRNIL